MDRDQSGPRKRLGLDMDMPDRRCPTCGLSRSQLYDRGLLGCASCYQVFDEEVQRALREIHGAVRHIGKSS